GIATRRPRAPAAFSPILSPGPKLTTMFGTTIAGSGPTFYLPQIATGPMGTKAGQFTKRYGFGATTGTVFVQLSTYSQSFFTAMGLDARTPLGAGNLSVTAGGIAYRHSLAGRASYGTFQKVRLTLAPAIPSLSPGGFVPAG